MDKEFDTKKKALSVQIEDQIFAYIQLESVPIGGKLPNEFEMGEMFGVGRSTIREAVKALVTKGILEIRRGAGTFVRSTVMPVEDPLGLREVEDKLALALDLVEVRMMLEPDIAEMAALRATEEDIRELKEACDLIEQLIRNQEPYIQADIHFHKLVAECSKNKVVEQLIPIIDTAVMMFVNVTHKKLTEETIMTHRQVVNAIRERDALGARTAMLMHLTFNRNMIRALVKAESNRKSE